MADVLSVLPHTTQNTLNRLCDNPCATKHSNTKPEEKQVWSQKPLGLDFSKKKKKWMGSNETFQSTGYLEQFQLAILGWKKHFWRKKIGARKNGYLLLTLKMGMEKGLVNKDWQERQTWHEDAKYKTKPFCVFFFPLQGASWSWSGGRAHSGVNSSFNDVSLVWVPYSRHHQPWQTRFLALAHLWDLDYSCTALSFRQEFQRFHTN